MLNVRVETLRKNYITKFTVEKSSLEFAISPEEPVRNYVAHTIAALTSGDTDYVSSVWSLCNCLQLHADVHRPRSACTVAAIFVCSNWILGAHKGSPIFHCTQYPFPESLPHNQPVPHYTRWLNVNSLVNTIINSINQIDKYAQENLKPQWLKYIHSTTALVIENCPRCLPSWLAMPNSNIAGARSAYIRLRRMFVKYFFFSWDFPKDLSIPSDLFLHSLSYRRYCFPIYKPLHPNFQWKSNWTDY